MSTQKQTTKLRQTNQPVTWAQAVRDIIVLAMNRGQLFPLALAFMVILIIWKMPDSDASKLMFDIIDKLEKLEMWAYIMLLISLLGWFFHTRSMRRQFNREFRRIGKEKSKLQSQKARIHFKSSNKS